jgi:phi LC3 family holin
MINWKVRIQHPTFWIGLVAAVLLLIQTILAPFGITVDFGVLNEQLVAIINAVFGVLVILGIVADPTTKGLSDSTLAMTYEIPKTKEGLTKKEEA